MYSSSSSIKTDYSENEDELCIVTLDKRTTGPVKSKNNNRGSVIMGTKFFVEFKITRTDSNDKQKKRFSKLGVSALQTDLSPRTNIKMSAHNPSNILKDSHNIFDNKYFAEIKSDINSYVSDSESDKIRWCAKSRQ